MLCAFWYEASFTCFSESDDATFRGYLCESGAARTTDVTGLLLIAADYGGRTDRLFDWIILQHGWFDIRSVVYVDIRTT